VLVILTTVYGYILAHRAITAVLREPQGATVSPVVELRNLPEVGNIRVTVCAEERVFNGMVLGEVKQGRREDGDSLSVPSNFIAAASL
jgi:hypothetical protein